MFALTPLATVRKVRDQQKKINFELTAYVGARVELGHHLRVHRDHDLLLLGHEGVPVFDLLGDPLLEVLTYDGRANVHDPLLGDLRQVGRVGEVQVDLRVLADESKDLFERQVLVFRHLKIKVKKD